MIFYGKTDVGRRRAVNQDNFIIKKYSPDACLAVVCDGMGGANGGNIASSVAVGEFLDTVDRGEREHPAFFGMDEADILDLLSAAATDANRAVYRMAQSDPSLSGMGTTLVGCIIAAEKIYIVNVGDSRLYLTGYNGIEQMTHDHSLVQYLIDKGEMTPEEAKKSRNRSAIYRAVGIEKTVGADLFSSDIYPGSSALLCSDGLTNHVDPPELRDIIGRVKTPDDAERVCEALIDRANSRGGLDNITAVLLSV